MKKPITTVLGLLTILWQSALYAECKLGSEQSIDSFVQEMTISKARGDIEGMNTLYRSYYLDRLGQCSKDERAKLCGYDCNLQLGEYHLFMAADLPYYYPSDNKVLHKPEELATFAEDGIKILEEARQHLNPGQDLRDYIFKSAQLNILLARLHMTVGDLWYQNISEMRLQRLHSIKKEVQALDPKKSGNSVSFDGAKTAYDKAHWILQSLGLDVPAEDPAFASISIELSALQQEIGTRHKSLKRGFLFLDIDPEEFSFIPLTVLRNDLNSYINRVQEAEGVITGLMESWQQAKGSRSMEEINEGLRQQEHSISKNAYRIAKLEGLAQSMTNELEGKLTDLNRQQVAFEFERERYGLEFAMKMQTQNLQHEFARIQQQTAVEVLSIDQASAERKLNDIRWMMDWKIATTNLHIQLSQFDSEIVRIDNELKRQKAKLEQTDLEKTNVGLRIESIKLAKEQSVSNEKAIQDEKDKILVAQKASLYAQLCSVRNRLAFLISENSLPAFDFEGHACKIQSFAKTDMDYHKEVCELRNDQAVQNLNSMADTLCYIGYESIPEAVRTDPSLSARLSACKNKVPDNSTQRAFAQSILDNEMILADAEIAGAEKQRSHVETMIDLAAAKIAVTTQTFAAMEAAMLALESGALGATSLPKVYACACGMASGVITEGPDLRAAAVRAAEKARGIAERWLSITQFGFHAAQEVMELKSQLQSLKNTIEQNTYAKEVKRMHAARAVAEISGRSLDLTNEMMSKILEKGLTSLDCDRGTDAQKESLAILETEHNRLTAEIRSLDFRMDNLDLSIENEVIERKKQDLEISSLTNQKASLGIESTTLEAEEKGLDVLRKQTVERRKLISDLQGELSGLEKDADAQQAAIKQVAEMAKQKTLNLEALEYNNVTNVLSMENTKTQKMIEFTRQLEAVSELDSELKKDLIAVKEEINKQIETEREQMLNINKMQTKAADPSKTRRLFLASHENMATFTKSLPAFIEAKRTLLNDANRKIVLLRNQIKALVSLQGGDPLTLSRTEPVILAKNADDMIHIRTALDAGTNSRDQEIYTQTVIIPIPAGSGLAQQLALDSFANFEISPFARGQMDKLGYFSLWSSELDDDPNEFNQNLMLVDVNMIVNFSGCSTLSPGKRYEIMHKGQGLVFNHLSKDDPTMIPQLIVSKARSMRPSYELKYADSIVEQSVKHWLQQFRLATFLTEEVPENLSGRGTLPGLLGMPLIGQYSIALPLPPDRCSYENAEFILYFSYATKSYKSR